MDNVTEVKILPYSVSELFDLVIDVEKYPEFLPWVTGTKIISKYSGNNPQLANADGFIGDTEHRTAAYICAREDSSTGSTQKSPAVVEHGEITADMTVNFAYLTQSYRSKIKYEILENSSFIEVVAISGPFKKLYNLWKFTPRPEGTLVEFKIDFEFKTSLFNNIAASVFKSAVQKIITAFENRASEKYGSNKNPK